MTYKSIVHFLAKNLALSDFSIKFASAITGLHVPLHHAKIAQLVERHLAKVEVAGSNPVFRSNSTYLLEWWNR